MRHAAPGTTRLLVGAFAGVLILWGALLFGVIHGTATPVPGSSPPGSQASLLFCSDRAEDADGPQLFRMSLDGLAKHRVTRDPVCNAWEVAPGTLLAIVLEGGRGPTGILARYRQDPANPIAEWQRDTVHYPFTDVVGWSRGSRARDGDLVFAARDGSGQWDLFRVLHAGDSIVRLTDDPWVERNPARDPGDPDGPVVYTRYNARGGDEMTMRSRGGDLWAVPARGGEARRLTDHPFMDDHAQVRGDSVIFVRGRGVGEEDGNMDLFLLDVAAGVEERLTDNRWNDLLPAWSPDGRYLCWQSEEDGHYEMNIRVMALEDRRQRVLVDWPGRQANCFWSPDGGAVAFEDRSDGDWDAFLMPLDGGDPTNLTRFAGADDRASPSFLTASPLE